MNKIPKIAVSILLIISIILNPLGSVFTVTASAVITEFIAPIIIGLGVGAAEGLIFSLTQELVETYGNDITTACENARVDIVSSLSDLNQAGNVILLETSESYNYNHDKVSYVFEYAYVNPDLGLSGNELSLAQAVADGINERVANGADIQLIGDVNALGFMSIEPSTYETLKEIVSDSIVSEYYSNLVEYTDSAVVDMVQNGVLPTYDFNFVGPMPSISYPFTTGMASLQKDGFFYSVPLSSASLNGMGYIIDPDVCKSYSSNFDNVSAVKGNSAMGYYFTHAAYGYSLGKYVMYNNKLYYSVDTNFHDSPYNNSGNSRFIYPDYFPFYVDVEGNTFASVYDGGNYSVGIYWNKTGEVAASMPVVESVTNESDFEQTTGGGEVEIPRSEAEQIIGNALGLGLISPDSLLEIGTDGTITSADGISLAKLQEICDLIAEGNLQFEDIQSYLDLMTQLIGAGNLTATEQALLLENIKELEETQAKSIEEINTAVTSIASAIAIEGEIDLEFPEITVIDKFPFCLPFDVYYIFTLLCTEPKEPIFEIPIQTTIETGGLNYEIDEKIVLDLTIFRLNGYDMVQIFTQSSITLLFVLCLIVATKKLMWK